MGNYLKQIYKISSANYQTLKDTGSLTYNGKTYKYDPNNLYLIENNLTDDYVLTGGGGSKLISELSVKHADSATSAEIADTATNADRAGIADGTNSVYNRTEIYDTDNPVWHSTSGDYTSGMYRTLHFDTSFTYNPSTDTLKVPNIEGTVTEAKKVTNKLTAGTKTYDGSAAVSLTKADLGLGNVDNISVVNYTEARGDNLITNGNGIMGNNYNFPALTFDPLVTNNCKGSFRTYGQTKVDTTEKLTLDFNSNYILNFDILIDKPDKERLFYVYVLCLDADGNEILPFNYVPSGSFYTTLAKDLNPGDTVVYLTDVSGFAAQTNKQQRGFIFWDYKDSFGYNYGDTYSRHSYGDLWNVTDDSFKDETANTITLASGWVQDTIKAGTRVSQRYDGATYSYLIYFTIQNTSDWVSKSASLSKLNLRVATRSIKIGFLLQWESFSEPVTAWLANVNLSKVILQDDTMFVKTSGNSTINNGALSIRNNTTEYPLRFNSLNGQNTYIDFMCDGVRYNALGVKNKTNDLLWNGNRITTVVDLANKVDKISGKQLSTNDYTTEEKTKLAGLSNAEALTNDEIDEAIK